MYQDAKLESLGFDSGGGIDCKKIRGRGVNKVPMAGKLKDYLNWIKIQLILIYYSRHYNTIYTIYIFAELVRIHLREGGRGGDYYT